MLPWSKPSQSNPFFSGYFKTRGQKFLIEPLGASDREEHAVYKYEALKQEPIKTCGLLNNSWEQDSSDPTNDIFKSSNSPEVRTWLSHQKKREFGAVGKVSIAQIPIFWWHLHKGLMKHREVGSDLKNQSKIFQIWDSRVTSWVQPSCLYWRVPSAPLTPKYSFISILPPISE